jgi:ABC-type multidrug transport system fused ATPase/permease subunit
MSYNQLVEDLGRRFNQLKLSLFQFLPNLIGALVIFLLGLLLARLIRVLIDRFIANLDRLIPNRSVQRHLQPFIKEKPVAKIISSVAYWILVFIFLTVATETLRLPVVTAWLSGLSAGLIGGVIIRDVS